jgi:hypothetical protein
MKKYHLGLIAFFAILIADEPPPSPEMIEQQLQDAEEEFAQAKEMFNPWYTGPLLTPSYAVLPVGVYNLQPYLFITDNFALFDNNGRVHGAAHDKIQVQFVPVFQTGIVDGVSIIVQPQYLWAHQHGQNFTFLGDTKVGVNIRVVGETAYRPGLTIIATETFPTGRRYQRLKPKKEGVDALGSGAYTTTLGLVFGKLVWWEMPKHPMRFRAAFLYQHASRVDVHDFNAYGGGYGTRGKVHLGDGFSADIGYELSFTQRWVFAIDLLYNFNFKTTFSGRRGLTAAGEMASVGGPFGDQISLAPAIEYNWSSNFGVIAGVWFSPWGRNTPDFVSGIISVNCVW